MSLKDLRQILGRLGVVLSLALMVLLSGCSDQSTVDVPISSVAMQVPSIANHQINEASPPSVIQELRQLTEGYQPQVSILSPKPDEVVSTDQVDVRFQVNDLPLFSDPKLGMGPHLEVILDNQPYFMVYDLNQPLTLQDLEPGTHTLRVFASRPWHESFKNEGAYAQTTFHVFTKSQTNTPNPELPLLTYSRPTGTYGAEPILLDFYLTNAPLHLVAQESAEDEIGDWRIRCTVNGESFVIDRWQPIYLKGFKKGKNWVKLEFLDENGDPVKNEFNTTVRVFTYEPNGQDTLSKLVKGKLTLAQARGMVDATYATPEPAKVPETQPVEAVPVEVSPVQSLPLVSEPASEPAVIAPSEPAPPETLLEAPQKPLPPAAQELGQQEPTVEASPALVKPTKTETPEMLPEASPVPSSEPEINPSNFADEVQSPSPAVESASKSTTVAKETAPDVAHEDESSQQDLSKVSPEEQPGAVIEEGQDSQPESTEIVQPEQLGSAER